MTVDEVIELLTDARSKTNPTVEVQGRVEGTSQGLEVADVVIHDDYIEIVVGA